MLRWYSTVVEARDHRGLAAWWARALRWQVWVETDEEAVVVPPWAGDTVATTPFERVPPGLVFVPVEHAKEGKNRLHLDLAPHVTDDRRAELARLLALGATRVDVGQGAEATWDVLADPEGNEFCLLSSRDA